MRRYYCRINKYYSERFQCVLFPSDTSGRTSLTHKHGPKISTTMCGFSLLHLQAMDDTAPPPLCRTISSCPSQPFLFSRSFPAAPPATNVLSFLRTRNRRAHGIFLTTQNGVEADRSGGVPTESCHVIYYHDMSCHSISRHVTLHTMLCHVILHVISHPAIYDHVMLSCHAMSYHALSCYHVMPWHVMLSCNVM